MGKKRGKKESGKQPQLQKRGRKCGEETCDGVIEQSSGEKNGRKEKKMILFYFEQLLIVHTRITGNYIYTPASCWPSRSNTVKTQFKQQVIFSSLLDWTVSSFTLTQTPQISAGCILRLTETPEISPERSLSYSRTWFHKTSTKNRPIPEQSENIWTQVRWWWRLSDIFQSVWNTWNLACTSDCTKSKLLIHMFTDQVAK